MPVHKQRLTQTLAALVLLLLFAVAAGFVTQPGDVEAQQGAVQDSSMESRFIASLNQTRATRGLGPLTQNAGMTQAARSWTYSMVSGTFLAHASDIVSGTPGGWSKVGENVGRGQTVDTLMVAFMNSPSHAQNVLDPSYTHVGVGVVIHPNGRVYTTHRFAALPGLAAQPVAAPAPPPATATPIPPPPPATATPAPPPPATATPAPPPPATATPVPPPPPATATPAPPATATPAPPTATAVATNDASFGEPPTRLAFEDHSATRARTTTSWFASIDPAVARQNALSSWQAASDVVRSLLSQD